MMQEEWPRKLKRVGLLVGSLLAGIVCVSFLPAWAQNGNARLANGLEPLTDTYPFYQNEAIALSLTYLQNQQQANGGIDSFGYGADPGGTARAVYALNAVGYPTSAVKTDGGTTMIDFLKTQAISYSYAAATPADDNLFPGRAGLLLAAAADEDPTSFGGVNLVEAIATTLKPTGAYSTTATEGYSSGAASPVNQSFAIFGLVAAGQPIPEAATNWLINAQGTNGSWGGDIDVTSYGIMALIGSGNVSPTHTSIQKATDFLRSQQTTTSALWNDTSEFGEPTNSTAWSMNALATAGYMPVTESWAKGTTDPQKALLTLQDEEGVFGKTYKNAYATLEAFYGLTAQPLYMALPARTNRALSWMAEQQNDDGGWPSFSTASDPGATLDNVLAFAAAGYNPASVATGSASPLDYLENKAVSYTRNITGVVFPSGTGKLIVAVAATGGNPRSYGPDSLNLVSDLQNTLQPTGAYSTTASAASPLNQSLAMLGLVAAGETVPQEAIDWLIAQQGADGNWNDIDTTGVALQALRAAGVAPDDAAIVSAITALRDSQLESGGWEASGSVSTNSTAFAIQGLLAAGVDLTSSEWLRHGRSPLGVLASYQKPDGPFALNWNYAGISDFFNPTADNLYATQQALPALMGHFYPYASVDSASLKAFEAILRGPDPDRMVAVKPFATLSEDGTSATVIVPFGSDLDGDGDVTLEWRVEGGSFTPVSTTREIGFYKATIALSSTNILNNHIAAEDNIELHARFTDPDGVQNGGTMNETEEDINTTATSSIAGTVTDENDVPLAGVTITDSAGNSTTTGNDGSYSLSNLPGDTYTLMPTLEGYTFTPEKHVVIVPPDATGQDFTAKAVEVSKVFLPVVNRGGGTVEPEPEESRAGLVVRFSDGTVMTDCVTFSEDEISGATLLQRSDFTVETYEDDSLGTAVCKINNEGCPEDTCFCDPDNNWKYFLWGDGTWGSSPVGASSRTVTNGDLDGWAWGGFEDEQAEPPETTFAEVCPET